MILYQTCPGETPLSRADSRFLRCLQQTAPCSRLYQSTAYRQHGNTSVFLHSVAVAYYSYRLAKMFRCSQREQELIRGALLHDYFLYDWHHCRTKGMPHGFSHPQRAYENAKADFAVTALEADIIRKHMFPLTWRPPRYKESAIVCLVDKACAIYETLRMGRYQTLRRRFALPD